MRQAVIVGFVVAVPSVVAAQPAVFAPPSAMAPAAPQVVEAPAVEEAAARPERWLAVGVLSLDGATAAGARLQVDLVGGRRWSFGLAGTVLDQGDQVMGRGVPAVSGLGYLAATMRLVGPLTLRGQLGVGVQARATSAAATATEMTRDAVGAGLVGEAALFAGVELGEHWGLTLGPTVQRAGSDDTITWFAGLRHR